MTQPLWFGPGVLASVVGSLFWLAVLAFAVGLWRRARLWARGQAAPIPWRQLSRAPQRYLREVHDVVAREPSMAKAHMFAAGGTVLALLVVALNYGLWLGWWALDLLLLLAAALVLWGSRLMLQRRRAPVRPARLSVGPWQRLPWSIRGFGLGVLGLSLLSLLGWDGVTLLALLVSLLLLWGMAELALGVGSGGPMKHAVTGLLNLAFHPRPERFADQAQKPAQAPTALRVAATEQGDWGVDKPAQFGWQRLLNFDACVQCGKCEAECPAFAAGQPLNPKKLIQDLVVGMRAGSDATFAGSPYPGMPLGQHRGAPDQAMVPQLLAPETVWSCTTCRACVHACPMMVEHVDAIVDVRRHVTMVAGALPQQAAERLHNLRETDTQGGFGLHTRHYWGVDLNLRFLAEGETADCLLLVGEGGFDMRYQRTLRALVKTLQQANIEVAVLGADETDCGDLARRLGDEVAFGRLAHQLMAAIKARSVRRIVTADPHIYHCLKNEYPDLDADFGRGFTLYHHTQLLAELLRAERLTPLQREHPLVAQGARITYHDPCYLGRYNQEFAAPRSALNGIGIVVEAMPRSGPNARCCGGGGGAPYTDIPGKARIPDQRMQDVRASGATVVAVACPQCTVMLEGVSGDVAQVMDVAELVATAVGVSL
ncbi:MAG: DUF3483 domain-containing protein [Neisseriaceae bacterium]|nr:DUF3483 domain-containing protein [Neisseriaceae bacterium]